MSNKRGRPKITNPKNKTISIRMTGEEAIKINELELFYGIKKSQLIRDFIKKYEKG